jgi:hypothetical protein
MSLSVYELIVNKMLSYCNKTLDDLKNDPEFYYKNKLTSDQYFEWYEWSLNLLYQNFPNRKQEDIKKEFDFFDITRGLLYIYERPATVWTEEDEKAFSEIKQKRLGKDETLKNLYK